MRIAQILDSLKIGGAQKLQITLSAAARAQGLELTVISLQDSPDSPIPAELERNGAKVVTFASPALMDLRRIRRISSFLTAQNIDVVQTHLTSANIIGTIAAAHANRPAIATLHTAGIDLRYHRPVRRMLESILLKSVSARVIAVGHAVADANKKRLMGKRIDVIPNAVPIYPQLSRTERDRVRATLIENPSGPLLISVGRLSPPKGYEDLLESFAKLRADFPQAALLIAGGGVLYPELDAKIKQLQLHPYARLLGPRNDVPRLLAAADLYVCSSHWEGLPVSILEAMAAGLPVVSTSVGDIPHVIADHTGLLVPPRNVAALTKAIAEMLRHPESMKTMAANARAQIEQHYGPDAWMEKLHSLYSEVSYGQVTFLREAR